MNTPLLEHRTTRWYHRPAVRWIALGMYTATLILLIQNPQPLPLSRPLRPSVPLYSLLNHPPFNSIASIWAGSSLLSVTDNFPILPGDPTTNAVLIGGLVLQIMFMITLGLRNPDLPVSNKRLIAPVAVVSILLTSVTAAMVSDASRYLTTYTAWPWLKGPYSTTTMIRELTAMLFALATIVAYPTILFAITHNKPRYHTYITFTAAIIITGIMLSTTASALALFSSHMPWLQTPIEYGLYLIYWSLAPGIALMYIRPHYTQLKDAS